MRLKPGNSVDLFTAVPSMTEDDIIKGTSIPNGDIYREVVVKRSIVIERSSLSTFRFDPDGVFDSIVVGDTLHINNEDGLILDTVQWEDLRIPLTSIKGGGVKTPGFEFAKNDGAGSTGVFSFMFDPGLEEELFFNVQMPHGWLEGSIIRPHLHWMPTNTGSGNVAWGFEYTKANVNEVFGNTTILKVTDAADGIAYKQQVVGFGDIDMTDNKISAMFMCRIFRDATDAINDTYSADAAGLEIDFHYQVDAFGSRQMFVK